MFYLYAYGDTLPQAYHNAIELLWKYGSKVECSDWNTECLECGITINIEKPLAEPMISRCFVGGARELEQYRQEMLDGILDFEVANGKLKYTYHDRMMSTVEIADHVYTSQLRFVVDELRRNPYSRRAVIDVRNSRVDAGSNDPACLQHIQFFIRRGRLDCVVLFRSNDAVKATFMNAFALIMLQKKIADQIGVPVGTYTHNANSFHAYKRDWGLLEAYVKRAKTGEATYNYAGEYEELMKEAQPEIKKAIEKLKGR